MLCQVVSYFVDKKLHSQTHVRTMGEWMSVLETPSPLIAKMAIRKASIRQSGWRRGRWTPYCSELVHCMTGDVANLAEIEGIDFDVVNQDLIDYYAHCEGS